MTTRKKHIIDFEYEEVLGPKIRRLIQAGCAVVADASPAEIREALSVGIMELGVK